MKILAHTPPCPSSTYDLMGLSEAQYDKILLLLGEVVFSDSDTREVFDAMNEMRKPAQYHIFYGPTNTIRFSAK